ncbi:MAG: hypothetical protein COA50_00255 [Flavobacteriaceae bacterium]|nr:MAG: hypothetical protein COA50_00255 [Flavobacteriaceae bacterium]
MKEQFELIKNLTPGQRHELDKDMQQIYLECHKQLNGKLEKLKDVIVNLNLNNEVYLNVVCEYDGRDSDNVKGRITHLHKYANKKEYDIAVAIEKASLN